MENSNFYAGYSPYRRFFRFLFLLIGIFTLSSVRGQASGKTNPLHPEIRVSDADSGMFLSGVFRPENTEFSGYTAEANGIPFFKNNRSQDLVRSLSGLSAGLTVTPTGGTGAGAILLLRGGNSLYRENGPLLIVDGILYDNSTVTGRFRDIDGITPFTTVGGNRAMDLVLPDIESVSILKGPAAAALYGARGGNGVLIITTKKGKPGKISVGFSSCFISEWINRYPERQEIYGRGFYETGGVPHYYTIESWGPPLGNEQKSYNNLEDFFRNGTAWHNHLNISGASKTGHFYFSASRQDQSGIIPSTGYEKTSFRFNGEQRLNRFSIGINTAYSVSGTDKTFTSGSLYNSGGTGALNAAYGWPQTEDMKKYVNEDGSQYRIQEKFTELAADTDNPYWIVNRDRVYDKTHRFTGALSFSYKPARWLDIRYRAGYDRYNVYNYAFIAPGSAVTDNYQNGKLSDTDDTYEYFSSDIALDFHHRAGKWNFRLLAGQSAEYTQSKTIAATGRNFLTEGLYNYENISPADKYFKSSIYRDRRTGIYGDLYISYDDLAYIGFTGRNDWLSVTPGRKQSYFYPSVSGAFVFSGLLPPSGIFTYGKIRASWGQTGQNTPFYELWGLPNENDFSGFHLNKNSGYEFGLQMRFLRDLLGLDFTYYYNKACDQLYTPRPEAATGYILRSGNMGKIINKGIEITLNAIPVQTKNLTWSVSINGWRNRSRTGDFPQGLVCLHFTDFSTGNARASTFPGSGLMGLSGYRWKRDNQNRIIVDANTGLPVPDRNFSYNVGNREPSLSGGLSNDIRYRNWHLFLLFEFRKGGDIYNGTDYYMTLCGTSARTAARKEITIEGVVNTGTEQNPVYVPKSTTYRAGEKYNINGDLRSGESLIQTYYRESLPYETAAFITETNWLRLRTVSLSYDFRSLIKRQTFLKGLLLTASGNNLWLWTNYKGMDPETASLGPGLPGCASAGINYCGIPATAGISLEIRLTF